MIIVPPQMFFPFLASLSKFWDKNFLLKARITGSHSHVGNICIFSKSSSTHSLLQNTQLLIWDTRVAIVTDVCNRPS